MDDSDSDTGRSHGDETLSSEEGEEEEEEQEKEEEEQEEEQDEEQIADADAAADRRRFKISSVLERKKKNFPYVAEVKLMY